MKYLLIALFFIFFIGCSQEDTNQTPPSSSYYLTYNDTSTEVTGQVTFDVGNIPNNHTVTLTNFRPSLEGCNVDLSQESVDSSPITFTSLTTKKTATLDIKLLTTCTQQNLILKADYKDISLLDGTLVTQSKEMTYNYEVDKVATASSYTPVLKTSSLKITKNSQTANIVVSVFDSMNRPAKDGTISIIYPNVVKENIDVGDFSPTTVDIKDGVASFVYTAPNDLTPLVDDKNSTTFDFYYNDDAANRTRLTINFAANPDQIVNKNYTLELKPENDEYKLQLQDSKSFSITLVDDSKIPVEASKINTFTVSLENSFIATLKKSDGTEDTNATYTNENAITMSLKSGTKSGLVSILVDANFIDVNGVTRDINETLSMVVESGPPTAISISYVDTAQDKDRAKFIERFAISVTDRYFNPVNTKPGVSVGAIVGYAHYGTPAKDESNRIFEDDKSSADATLSRDSLTITKSIDINTTDIGSANDILVTFGDGYSYPASGGWLFDQPTSKHTIPLVMNQYTIDKNTTKLGYAIGHNYRQDQCILGREWLGQTTLQNGVTTLDEKGTAIAELSYDYYLVGKDILFYVNIIAHDNKLDKDLRVGEALKHTLRGHGLEFVDNGTFDIPADENVIQQFKVWIKDTVEPYRNANFYFGKIDRSDGCSTVTHLDTYKTADCSYPNGNISNGRAYVELNITAKAPNECGVFECTGCSITISEPYILPEF